MNYIEFYKLRDEFYNNLKKNTILISLKFNNLEKYIYKNINNKYIFDYKNFSVENYTKNYTDIVVFAKKELKNIINLAIPKCFIDDFYFILTKLSEYEYQKSYNRRAYRTKNITLLLDNIIDILNSFLSLSMINFNEKVFIDILKYNLDKEKNDLFSFLNSTSLCYLIMSYIEKGNKTVIDLIKSSLEKNTIPLTYQIIRGIIMSSNKELISLLCDNVLNAKLSEGLRQSVFENAECGSFLAFRMLTDLIKENNLLRFSSIKRAMATWTGIGDGENDRLNKKIFDDIYLCLNNRENISTLLDYHNPIDFYMGLWGLALYDIDECFLYIKNLALFENKQNIDLLKIASCFIFFANFKNDDNLLNLGFNVINNNIGNKEIFALYYPIYPYNSYNINKLKIDKNYFSNTELIEKNYNMLTNLFSNFNKKEVYSIIGFEWFKYELEKSDILSCIYNIANFTKDNDKIDFVCKNFAKLNHYDRCSMLNIIKKPKTEIQRKTFITAITDKDSYVRDEAIKLFKNFKLNSEDYIIIESFAKYKREDIRKNLIDIFKLQSDKDLYLSINRMIGSNDENTRLIALDLLKYALNQRDRKFFDDLSNISTENQTSSEKILTESLLDNQVYNKDNGYTIYNKNAIKNNMNLKSDLSIVKKYFKIKESNIQKIIDGFVKIVNENKNRTFISYFDNEVNLDNLKYNFKINNKDYSDIPFSDLWKDFYEKYIKDENTLMCFIISNYCYSSIELINDFEYEKLKINIKKFFPVAYFSNTNKTYKEFNNSTISQILNYLQYTYNAKIPYEVVKNIFAYIVNNFKKEDFIYCYKKYGKDTYIYDIFNTCEAFNYILDILINYLPEHFEDIFHLLDDINHKIVSIDENLKSNNTILTSNLIYIKAFELGIISKDYALKSIFELNTLEWCAKLFNTFDNKFYRYRNKTLSVICKMDKNEFENSNFYHIGKNFGNEFFDLVLKTELKRGDSTGPFSNIVKEIKKIYGSDTFFALIRAIGSANLKNTSYFYSSAPTKIESLSYLLKNCYPDSDDKEKFFNLANKYNINKDKYFELALFCPQWVDIISSYLNIEGFKSGVYYFLAHTSESIDEKKEAIIQKYTPLSKEELNSGCFDAKWFNESYSLLGEENFKKLYENAKYISSSNYHTRAKKYYDAYLGNISLEEIIKIVTDKRDKDYLMSIGIIPLKDKNDLLFRYNFIQKYIKESKNFGTQRKLSESNAGKCGLINLSKNAGYEDFSMFTLIIENEISTHGEKFFEWTSIDNYQLKINIENNYFPKILIKSDKKNLTTIPSSIKKNEIFIELKSYYDIVKEQLIRTKKIFEDAMIQQDEFNPKEILSLSKNLSLKNIIENIVFINKQKSLSGIIVNGDFVDHNEQILKLSDDEKIFIAHPYDLFKLNVWSNYQNIFYKKALNGIKQPFKQVFREIYTKLDEEKDKCQSMLFAGNQINVKKTIGALKNHNWICDYEDGLQRVFYKENIIAQLFAIADWFSPSDIEEPTLEYVAFQNRKTFENIKISNIPDIIYSEVMRDVDLAISISHFSGYNPITSHSTIELRKTIIEFNLKLFNINNVTFDGNFANIKGFLGEYSIHIGTGVIHQFGGHQINVLPVSNKENSKIFLPFIDDDPKSSEVITKILFFANDKDIKDPFIINQIKRNV